uniref:Variant surface glycoprotein n=1 Tax=Trypanosoma brucei TaxID=5691 RepID=A0A1V0G095_9TRYP|nr:variant surface glycoprotein [Trypanosoma brucei]
MIAVVTAILQAMSMTDKNKAAATKGDSAVGYLALCSAWSAAKKASTATLPTLPASTAFDEIQQFNISLATAEWQSLIDGTPGKKGWEAIKATVQQKTSAVDWSKEWPGWESAREATKDNSNQWNKNNPRGFADSHIPELRELINATANQAKSLIAELRRPLQIEGISYQQKIQQLGQQAMCGATAKHVFVGKFCKDTDVADATKSTTCAKTNNGMSIGMDIVCMCTASTHDKCVTGASGYTAGSETIKTAAIKELTDECPGTAADGELADAVSEALTATRNAVVYSGSGGTDKRIIGKAAGNSCAAAGDWCVDYSDYYQKNKGFDQIPWVKHLLEIAKLYKEYTKRLAEKTVIKSQLEALRDRVRIEYTRNRPETKLMPTQVQGQTTPTAESSSKENVCDKHHASQDNCTKNGCDYDENGKDGKKCKPKPGKENTATGTEGATKEGAEKKEEKCAGKLEDACKKDTGCNWDGKECKDSSFLLNNQLALSIVSAAFVALLF